ncbi:MAG: smalltalk protein [Bacteroidaceae bacterium]|nr:smalltalk protein [Bacteroidaceae bacterium]
MRASGHDPCPYNPPNPNLNLLTLNNILITVLTAIATTFGVTSCM